jgi:8-oxo-dGTP pyrophosphatase MutT (NUDIX family)
VKPASRACGAVVFRRSDHGVRLLLLRAYKNWDFPKGLVEPGENELEAAKREVREETGLSELDYPFGDDFKETVPYAGNKVARYYLAETDAEKIELPVSPGKPRK